MKRKIIQGLGLLTVSVAPLAMVVSCTKKPTSNIDVDPNSFLASLNKNKKTLGWLLKGLLEQNKNTTNNLLIQDIENKLVFYLYDEEQKASVTFSKARKKMHEKYTKVPTFDKLPTEAELRKDAGKELKDAIELVKHRFGIHQWEKAWAEQRKKNYGGALSDSQAIDYILRNKMANDAFGRFSLKVDSSTFVKLDFFKEGTDPSKKESFKNDNIYGLKFEDVLVKPKANPNKDWEDDADVYVYETKSYVANARRGEKLKKIFVKYNNIIVPIHYLLPVVPGKEAADPWVATKKANLQDIVKKLLHTNDNELPVDTKYKASGFNAMMDFKGLNFKNGKFDVSAEDGRALRDGPDGNASKENGGALGMFGSINLLNQMAPGYSISSLTSILDEKEVAKHVRIESTNPLEGLQAKIWAALEKLKKGAFPKLEKKDTFDGENFNKAVDKLIDKLDKEKFADSIGDVFKNAFGSKEISAKSANKNNKDKTGKNKVSEDKTSKGKRTLIYQDKNRNKNIAVSQFGVHIMSSLKKEGAKVKKDIDFVNLMIKDDLLQTSQGKSTRMNVESKISSFVNQSKLGSVSLYMVIEYLQDKDFVKYLKNQTYNTQIDPKTGEPVKNIRKYNAGDIETALGFSNSIIDSAQGGLALNVSKKIDDYVYKLLNTNMINSWKDKPKGLWNEDAGNWLQKAIFAVEKGGK